MAYTYTATPYPVPWPYIVGSPPPQTCIDTVRFILGDTLESDPQLQDGEVVGLLAQNVGDPYQSAIEGCRALATRYARQADKSVGDLRISASQKSKAYEAMVLQIQAQAIRFATPVSYAGGISEADRQIDLEDDDRVEPAFSKGMMDDRGTAIEYGDLTDGYGQGYGTGGYTP